MGCPQWWGRIRCQWGGRHGAEPGGCECHGSQLPRWRGGPRACSARPLGSWCEGLVSAGASRCGCGTAVPAVPTILLSPLSLPPLLSLLSPPSSHSAGLAASPIWAQKSTRVDRDGAMSPQQPPASSCSHPMSLLPLGQQHQGPQAARPCPQPSSQCSQRGCMGLPVPAGIQVRTLRQVSPANRPAPPLSPHRHLCLGTLLGHPCRPPARPRPLNELKK